MLVFENILQWRPGASRRPGAIIRAAKAARCLVDGEVIRLNGAGICAIIRHARSPLGEFPLAINHDWIVVE